jgi:ABC-2 type transport system ATP-binding protein
VTPAAEAVWGVHDLTVRYGHRLALQGIDLCVPSHQVTAVVGGDGSGKSTLLRTLAGAVRPASGSVDRPPARRIGYVAATSGVYTDLTVDENIVFVARAYGLRDGRPARTASLLDRAGLSTARDRLAGKLSGGMRQKLAFVLAVLAEPKLLILDEPTTGVDPVSRAEIWRLIADAAARGAAIALATTYLDEAERAAQVLVLDRGRALLAGPPDEVATAVPGALCDLPPAQVTADLAPLSWRNGAMRRVWAPGGTLPPGAAPVQPRLADAVVVACLQAEVSASASGPESAGAAA